MKQVDKLILRSFIGPLVLTFLLAVFVLLMQFLWKYIDDMVGKGLDFWVIAQLLFYASATFVPMALPIATLFASIMTMGNFGEKYESPDNHVLKEQ
jgi:lipopolysaccharide export system permease protein